MGATAEELNAVRSRWDWVERQSGSFWDSSRYFENPPQVTPKPTRDVIRAPNHSRPAYDMRTFRAIAEWGADGVRRHGGEALVACGHSGLVIAGAVGLLASVPVFAVRKKGEHTEAGGSRSVTGVAAGGPVTRWVWIDDIVSCGRTFWRSARECEYHGLIATRQPVVALLYRSAKPGPIRVDHADEPFFIETVETFADSPFYQQGMMPY